jgi:hypothetical protein
MQERIWISGDGVYKGIVYKATNKENGMFYIGQTTRGLAYRKYRHIHDRRKAKRDQGSPFHSALDQYGEMSFEWVILYRVEEADRESLLLEMDRLESLEISNAKDGECYNSVTGGRSGFGYSDDMKRKISTGLSGKYAGANSKMSKPVARYSMDGKLLATYVNAREASEMTRLSRGFIVSCCNGKYKSAGGWKWVYVTKETNEH